jgi:hypothetical protein
MLRSCAWTARFAAGAQLLSVLLAIDPPTIRCAVATSATIRPYSAPTKRETQMPMPPLISRQEALAHGYKRYFTGAPCKHGHVAERWVSNLYCVVCKRLRSRLTMQAWCAAHPEEHRLRKQKSYQRHRETNLLKYRQRWIANRDRYAMTQRAWRVANQAYLKATKSDWNGRRRSPDQQHHVIDSDPIMEIMLACPPDMVVDHIVPLGKKALTADGYPICGLHAPVNLQYLSDAENRAKSNRMRAHEQALCET